MGGAAAAAWRGGVRLARVVELNSAFALWANDRRDAYPTG